MNNQASFQDAIARAREIAQRLTASAPNSSIHSGIKRPNSDDDYSSKRPSFGSSADSNDLPTPVLRAQLVAQKINSQLGVRTSDDSSSLPLSNQLTFQEDYKIPDKFVGLIIGKGGEQIIRLQADSGCKVQICQIRPEPLPDGPNPPDRIANLCGSRDAIDRARRIMDDIIGKGRTIEGGSMGMNPYSTGGSGIKSNDVMIPSAKCGLVIGKGGENIKRMAEEFCVKLFVGQDTCDIDGIEHKPLKISGDPDKVERAKQYVQDFLSKSGGPSSQGRFGGNANGNSSFNDYGSRSGGAPMSGPCNEASYHAPHEKAGIIIGKGGESIKEINRKSGAFVELDKAYMPAIGNSSDRVFKIRGTPEQIVLAQQLMYDKTANSPGGCGDMLTPAQFQQHFNLPSVPSSSMDSWGGNADHYGNDHNGAAANDPYSQWANAYGQWPQMNPYDTGTATNNNASSSTDASAMSQMDPAWIAYYQSMSYYNMMQAGMTGAASTGASTSTTTTKPTDSGSTSNGNSTTAAANPTAGQADYSQQWIEYYRSVGQNDIADQISQQMKESGSTTATATPTNPNDAAAAAQAAAMMMSASNPWAAYAQQYHNGANGAASTTSDATNGNTGSSSSS